MQNILIKTQEEDCNNDLNLQATQDFYSCERFIETLRQRHRQTILFYCPYDQSTLRNYYQRISQQYQTQLLNQQTVREFITTLKERNCESFRQQIKFYQTEMLNLLGNNIQKISFRQFMIMIDRLREQNTSDFLLITEIMIENSKGLDYIACEKVFAFTQQVRAQIQQNIHLELTVSKLKAKKLQESVIESNIQPINQIYLESYNQKHIKKNYIQPLLKQLIVRYMQDWHQKVYFFREFVSDLQVREDMQNFIQKISQRENLILQQAKDLILINEENNIKHSEIEKAYLQVKEHESIYINLIQKYKNSVAELNQIIAKQDQENNRYLDQNKSLILSLESLKSNLHQLSLKYQQIQKELDSYKILYYQLYQQYQSVQTKKNQSITLKKQQQKRKIFVERTIKEQLEDAMAKLERTLALREKEKKIFEQQRQNNKGAIMNLQNQLQQLHQKLKEKKENLGDYTELSNIRISLLRSSITHNRQSQLLNSSVHPSNNRQKGIENKKNFRDFMKHTKFNNIKIGVNNLAKYNILDQTFSAEDLNLIRIIQQDSNLNRNAFHNKLLQTTKIQADCTDVQNLTPSNNPYFRMGASYKQIICAYKSRAVLIDLKCRQLEMILLITEKRLCCFDISGKLLNQLPVANIKKIIFTYQNPSIFVIRILNNKQVQDEKHTFDDKILSIRNRDQFISFLSQNYRQKIRENKIQIIFQKEQQLFVSIDQKNLNLKDSFPEILNPIKLGLASQNIFYAQGLQEGGFPNFYKQFCLIVQPAAIFCFQASDVGKIQSNIQFNFILPIVQNMNVEQQMNSPEAFGRKLKIEYSQMKNQEKTYILVFQDKQNTKKFTRLLTELKQTKITAKNSWFRSLSKLFDQKKLCT